LFVFSSESNINENKWLLTILLPLSKNLVNAIGNFERLFFYFFILLFRINCVILPSETKFVRIMIGCLRVERSVRSAKNVVYNEHNVWHQKWMFKSYNMSLVLLCHTHHFLSSCYFDFMLQY